MFVFDLIFFRLFQHFLVTIKSSLFVECMFRKYGANKETANVEKRDYKGYSVG